MRSLGRISPILDLSAGRKLGADGRYEERQVALALPQFDTLSMGMSADLEAAVFGGR